MAGKKKSKFNQQVRVQSAVGDYAASRAKQSFKDECDINNIMRRFDKHGVITHLNHVKAQYVDVCDFGAGYQEAMNRVAAVRTIFEDLPATLRAEFNNDPAEFLDGVSDASDDELRGWGLMGEREHAARSKARRDTKEAEKAQDLSRVHERAEKALQSLTGQSEPSQEEADG